MKYSVEEVKEIVDSINTCYCANTCDVDDEEDIPLVLPMELFSNGDMVGIKFIGHIIWDSYEEEEIDDLHSYIVEKCNTIIEELYVGFDEDMDCCCCESDDDDEDDEDYICPDCRAKGIGSCSKKKDDLN